MKKEVEFVNSRYYPNGYNRGQALQSVGKGWESLVNMIFDKVQTYAPGIIITQVKEKWGGLRVYSTPYVEDFDTFLHIIEKKSFTVCELCGNDAHLRGGNYYQTLCDEHADGREPISPF